jgi:hypothetical protein
MTNGSPEMTEDDTFRALKKWPYTQLRQRWKDWLNDPSWETDWDEILDEANWTRREWSTRVNANSELS